MHCKQTSNIAALTISKSCTANINMTNSNQRIQLYTDEEAMLDDADQERFDRLRYVELKHGRICQLAFLGNIITRAGIHLPGAIDQAGDQFDSFPNGYAAVTAIPGAGLTQIILFV